MIDKLNIAHINIRSIKKKFDVINNFIIKNNVQILCVNETWLKPNQKYINLPTNYQIIRQDRINRKGGGVAIIHHKNIKIQTITKDQTHETIAIKIELNDTTKLNLISTYYPPNCTYNLDFLEKIINDKENNLIIGDLNAKSPI